MHKGLGNFIDQSLTQSKGKEWENLIVCNEPWREEEWRISQV